MRKKRDEHAGREAGRETIGIAELRRLAFCNSDRLPVTVEVEGRRLHWVGIGWVNEGDARGDEVLVVE